MTTLMTRRKACLGMLLLAGAGAGCGSGDLPTAPTVPKDFKPATPPPTGVVPGKGSRKPAAGSNES